MCLDLMKICNPTIMVVNPPSLRSHLIHKKRRDPIKYEFKEENEKNEKKDKIEHFGITLRSMPDFETVLRLLGILLSHCFLCIARADNLKVPPSPIDCPM